MTGQSSWLYGVLVLTLAIGPTFADTHTEVGDAGDLPATAQLTGGVVGNPLDSITGATGRSDEVDMFAIWIGNLAAFGASTDNGVTNFDTQLFLFDSGGFGVAFNDDGGSNLTSEFPVGSIAGAPGLYYIAVSGWNNDPSSAGGEIFPNVILSDDVEGPTGPGGGSPVSSWDGGGETGDYQIDLAGAYTTNPIPLPAAVWAGIALLGGIGINRVRRRAA